ncbi:MAG: hypothetical protein ACR2MG_00440 [Pyrinomonadaceae bacterium]
MTAVDKGEKNYWNSRFAIYCDVSLKPERYEFEDCEIKVEVLPEQLNQIIGTSSNLRFVNLRQNDFIDKNISEIHAKSLEVLNRFLNRISLVGFCKTEIIKHFSTSLMSCQIGQSFDVLWSGIQYENKYDCEITNKDLIASKNEDDANYEQALDLFRKALATNSNEEKLIFLTTCLERISEKDCQEYAENEYKCSECGYEGKTRANYKATRYYIRHVLFNNNGKDKDLFDKRHVIAHGGSRNSVFYDSLAESIGKSIATIASILAEKFGLNFVNATNIFSKSGWEIYTFNATKIGSQVDITIENGGGQIPIVVSIIEAAPQDSKGKLKTQFSAIVHRIINNSELVPFYFPILVEE